MRLEDISKLTERELLKVRLCDIEFDLKQSPRMRLINDLYFELNKNQINFLPKIWVSNDWFSPDGVDGFAIPFYLLHPRLIELEKKYTGRVEGKTKSEFMKLIRHETAHALDNAFGLRKNKLRQKLFGLSSKPYPKSYFPKEKSKAYVRNLSEFYAQAHPDEDWAETFAVWLNPNSNWKTKYRKWEAIDKLNLLEEIIIKSRHKKAKTKKTSESIKECITKDQRTLGQYYKEKRKELGYNKKKFIKNISPKLIQDILTDPIYSKKVIKKVSKSSFISKKLINELSNECNLNKNTLSFNKKAKVRLDEKEILKLTQLYIKTGKHKVIM